MSELKQQAIKGVRWTGMSAALVAVGGLVQTIVLTHLLGPADFGAMAYVNIALGLSVQMVDLGFSNAIIREENVTDIQLNSLYWLNIAMSLLIGAIVWFIAPYVAEFYRIPELVFMLRWIVPAFLLSGMSMQFQALLQRSLKFGPLAAIDVSSFVLGFVVAMVMALNHFGAYALVGGAMTKMVCSTLSLQIVGRKLHRPRFEFSKKEIEYFFSFGAYQALEKFIAYIAINLDSLIIGRILGAGTLGIYDVFKRMLIQPWYVINPIVTKVSYPVMAQVKNEAARFKNIVMRSIHMVAAINLPIYIGCAIGARFIVPVLFAPQWHTGVTAFQWLSVYFLFRALLNPLGSAALAKGRADISFKLNAIAFVGLFIAIFAGSAYNLEGIQMALVIFNILLVFPFYYLIIKPIVHANWSDCWKSINLEMFAAAIGFALAYAVVFPLGKLLPVIVQLLLYLAIGAAVYLFGLFRFRPHLLDELKQMIRK